MTDAQQTTIQTTADQNAVNTGALYNQKVYVPAPNKNDQDHVKKLGRVHQFVYHPKEPRCVGFLVKRPDMALMFHRKDAFVAFDGFTVIDGHIIVSSSPQAIGAGACKRLGINLDDCIIWSGLPVMTKDGETLGLVGNVIYDRTTGRVLQLEISQGATANTLLGKRCISASEILGFKRGMGTPLYAADETDLNALGALVVSDAAKEAQVDGGVAQKAGEATAIVADKAQKTYKKVVKKAKPKVEEASKVAGEAINKGAFVTGRQIGRASGMFGKFADEFKKGMRGE